MIVADLAQHFNGGHDAFGVLALNAGLFVRMCAESKVECVILPAQLVKGDLISDVHIQLHINAYGEKRRDLRVEHLTRQTVGRNPIAQHAAQLRTLFIYRDLVSHQSKVIRRGKTARPAADDGDRFPGRLGACGMRHITRMVDRVALEAADIDRVVDHISSAARLARVLADVRTS